MKEIIYYAIPFFVILIVLEIIYYRYVLRDHQQYHTKDSVSSISMGLGNVIIGIGAKVLVFASVVFLYQFRWFELNRGNVWYWIAIFFADDLSYYWFHRMSHQIRYFWASHVVHHSSQYYNLSTALRQTWTGTLAGSYIFYLWMPLIGFHPVDVLLMQTISLIYQFWIHTEAIKHFPPFVEFIFNTPSHHRVHHGSDVKYLDKNHGGILIIWDRIFGTFQQEESRPHYGIVHNLTSHHLFTIAFHEWKAMIQDVRKGRTFVEKAGYIFGPPGWSPDGSRKTTRQLREEMDKEEKSR